MPYYSPNGKWIAFGSSDCSVGVLDSWTLVVRTILINQLLFRFLIELIHLTFCPASPNDPQSPRTPLNNAPFQPKLESSRLRKRGQHGARSLDTERTRGFMYVCSLLRPLPGDLAVMLTYDVCSLADGVDRDYGCICGVVRDCAADVYCWSSLNCREQGFLLFGSLSARAASFRSCGRGSAFIYHRPFEYYNMDPS